MSRLIDADALKDVIRQHDYPLADRLNSIDNGMFTLGIFQAIDEQPTISPDDVRGVGKWIEDAMRIKCSVCGTDFNDEVTCCSDCYRWPWNYCPNCGVRMEVTNDTD